LFFAAICLVFRVARLRVRSARSGSACFGYMELGTVLDGQEVDLGYFRRRVRYTYPYDYHCDVSNPLLVPDLSGTLQQHDRVCDGCEGTGFEDFDYPDPSEACDACADGSPQWGSWHGEDRGRCGSCGTMNALVAAMYEDYAGDGHAWVCLVCYVRHHRNACGCDLWKDAEKRLAIFLDESAIDAADTPASPDVRRKTDAG